MIDIVRKEVRSSNIRSIGYDEKEWVLEIEFRPMGVYRYFGVSKSVYDALMAADSHGRYFNTHIRGRFEVQEAES